MQQTLIKLRIKKLYNKVKIKTLSSLNGTFLFRIFSFYKKDFKKFKKKIYLFFYNNDSTERFTVTPLKFIANIFIICVLFFIVKEIPLYEDFLKFVNSVYYLFWCAAGNAHQVWLFSLWIFLAAINGLLKLIYFFIFHKLFPDCPEVETETETELKNFNKYIDRRTYEPYELILKKYKTSHNFYQSMVEKRLKSVSSMSCVNELLRQKRNPRTRLNISPECFRTLRDINYIFSSLNSKLPVKLDKTSLTFDFKNHAKFHISSDNKPSRRANFYFNEFFQRPTISANFSNNIIFERFKNRLQLQSLETHTYSQPVIHAPVNSNILHATGKSLGGNSPGSSSSSSQGKPCPQPWTAVSYYDSNSIKDSAVGYFNGFFLAEPSSNPNKMNNPKILEVIDGRDFDNLASKNTSFHSSSRVNLNEDFFNKVVDNCENLENCTISRFYEMHNIEEFDNKLYDFDVEKIEFNNNKISNNSQFSTFFAKNFLLAGKALTEKCTKTWKKSTKQIHKIENINKSFNFTEQIIPKNPLNPSPIIPSSIKSSFIEDSLKEFSLREEHLNNSFLKKNDVKESYFKKIYLKEKALKEKYLKKIPTSLLNFFSKNKEKENKSHPETNSSNFSFGLKNLQPNSPSNRNDNSVVEDLFATNWEKFNKKFELNMNKSEKESFSRTLKNTFDLINESARPLKSFKKSLAPFIPVSSTPQNITGNVWDRTDTDDSETYLKNIKEDPNLIEFFKTSYELSDGAFERFNAQVVGYLKQIQKNNINQREEEKIITKVISTLLSDLKLLNSSEKLDPKKFLQDLNLFGSKNASYNYSYQEPVFKQWASISEPRKKSITKFLYNNFKLLWEHPRTNLEKTEFAKNSHYAENWLYDVYRAKDFPQTPFVESNWIYHKLQDCAEYTPSYDPSYEREYSSEKNYPVCLLTSWNLKPFTKFHQKFFKLNFLNRNLYQNSNQSFNQNSNPNSNSNSNSSSSSSSSSNSDLYWIQSSSLNCDKDSCTIYPSLLTHFSWDEDFFKKIEKLNFKEIENIFIMKKDIIEQYFDFYNSSDNLFVSSFLAQLFIKNHGLKAWDYLEDAALTSSYKNKYEMHAYYELYDHLTNPRHPFLWTKFPNNLEFLKSIITNSPTIPDEQIRWVRFLWTVYRNFEEIQKHETSFNIEFINNKKGEDKYFSLKIHRKLEKLISLFFKKNS